MTTFAALAALEAASPGAPGILFCGGLIEPSRSRDGWVG